jgi:hypothetical protein
MPVQLEDRPKIIGANRRKFLSSVAESEGLI